MQIQWMRALVMMAAVLGAGAAAAIAEDRAEVGDAAPAFDLSDQDGQTHTLSTYEGRIVLLEWLNPSCPASVYHHEERRTMAELASRFAEHDVVWLAIDSNETADAEAHREVAEEWELDYPILSDASGEMGRAYGARTTPHMMIVDAEGVLVYRGAIDDDPGRRGNEEVNYVEQALEELLGGEDVSEPETFPYGCRIRYAR